jgi:hypothetical protein
VAEERERLDCIVSAHRRRIWSTRSRSQE